MSPLAMDGRRRAATYLWLLACLPLAGCTKFQILNAMVPSGGYTRTADLAYGILPRQRLDVYQPKHAKAGTPVVVFFYGGYWQEGKKENYRFVGQAMTSRGYVAVLPDYRLYPPATFPAFVEDGALAVRWVHDHVSDFGGDPKRIYLMGHSAGAHIAALLTLDERYLRAAGLDTSVIRATAGLAGPYDFAPDAYDLGVFNVTKLGQAFDPDIEPIRFARRDAPPMLLVQGLRDHVVNPTNAQQLFAKLDAVGADARYIAYRKAGHAELVMALAWPFRWLAPVLRDTVEFFGEH